MAGLAKPRPSPRTADRRLVRAYQRVDRAVYAVEASIVTAATALMAVFIFLDLTFVFVDSFKIRLFPAEGAVAEPIPAGRLAAAAVALGLVLAMVVAGVRHHPRLGAASRAKQALAVGAIFAAICGLLVMLVTVHPRWTCTALVGLGAAYSGARLAAQRREPGGSRRLAIWAGAVALLAWFTLGLPDRYSSWTQPYAMFLLLWSGFVGASMATSQGRHLRIDAVRKAVPPRLASRFNFLSFLVAAALTGVLCYLAFRYTFARFGNPHAAGEIPDWLKVLAIPISLLLVALRFLMRGILALTGYVEPAVREGVLPAQPKEGE